MIEFLLQVSPTVYCTIAATALLVTIKLRIDSQSIKAVRDIQELAFEKAQRHHAPKLTILITANSLEGVQKTVQSFKAQYKPTDFIAVVNSVEEPQLARKLRREFKKNNSVPIQVIARKEPDLLTIANTIATGSLVTAVPSAAEPTKSFYKLAIMPFIQKNLKAVRLSFSLELNESITGGILTLLLAWKQCLNRLLPSRAISLEDTLPIGVVVKRRTALGKTIDTRTAKWAPQSSYALGGQKSTSKVVAALFSEMSPVCCVALTVLYAVCVAALHSALISHDTAAIFTFIAVAIISSFWSVSSLRVHSFITRIALAALAPLFVCVAPLLIVAHLVGGVGEVRRLALAVQSA